jgi:predicted aldo/keto reductase-like oxidoreductase
MQYRSFGGIDFRPSVLGFGAMRLPQLTDGTAATGDAYGRIDVETANAMLRRAVEAGVNYIDTAYPYHDGASERWLGQALPVVARVRGTKRRFIRPQPSSTRGSGRRGDHAV